MSNPNNPANNRWRWWYPAIADWMLRNPGKPLADCAKELGKHANTIYMITSADMFKTYLVERQKEWTSRHDAALREKTMRVAEGALDALAVAVEKKRDQIPVATLTTIATSALDRLGYSPNKAAPAIGAVNVQQNNGPTFVSVDAAALLEAQAAIRAAEKRRAAVVPEGAAPPLLSQPDVEVPEDVSSFVESAVRELTPESRVESAPGFPRTLSTD